jgi:hypothetical protein
MNIHVMTPEMMRDAGEEADRYLGDDLQDFYRRMKAKYGDVPTASGIVYCSLFMATARLLKAETRGICGSEPTADKKQRFDEAINCAIDAINKYRADIRQRSEGSLN